MDKDETCEIIPQQTYARHVVFYPVSVVWDAIRDFDAHGSWLPHVEATEMLDSPSGDIRTIRRLRFSDGSYADEQVTKVDDEENILEYTLVGETAWPIRDVRGIIAATGDESATLVERTVNFNSVGDPGAASVLIANFNAGLLESLEHLSVYLGTQLVEGDAIPI
ncbi:SRPBCC family protein (plasmid) [Sphingobium sp. SJ10-10]|uniref:SRPBCC family protein n=1 Tax=unclassified Sphingobium TaxID=2611147 RepID=UPI0007703D46|nr:MULTISPECIES: SRPBCC family protein [unclassified Sphingobium]AMK26545.1 hypothetical protein K426_28240 [Sphingobium sp. TKS]MEC6699569.1 SRPBCC family protein [Sphingobium sp. SJ10-10]